MLLPRSPTDQEFYGFLRGFVTRSSGSCTLRMEKCSPFPRRSPMPSPHPDRSVLEAFVLGALDEASLAAVEVHVAVCPACQQQAASTSGDTLVALLRKAHAHLALQPETVAESAAQVQTPISV